MKENIKILLDRRSEIVKEINKLEAEYKAIGDILTELHRYKEKEKNPVNYERG